jgi:ABC-type multidrug transport system fused ATPase/permease subunit
MFMIWITLVNYKQREKHFLEAYSVASGKAEEALQSIKTVKQFTAEEFTLEAYSSQVKEASSRKMENIIKLAVSFGALNCITFLLYTLGLWYGANCVMGSNHCPPSVSGKYYTSQ